MLGTAEALEVVFAERDPRDPIHPGSLADAGRYWGQEKGTTEDEMAG